MRKTILLTPIIAIAIVSMLFSCVDSEKDLYDPSYQTANPMGDGFAAPDGFDWNMITTKTLTVEVKDEWEGKYYYSIEIYGEDPLANENTSILAKGVANKNNNFTTSINLLPTQKGIYIKQIDPRGRKEIYLFDVPEDNNNFICKLYYSNTQSRALMSRTITTRSTSFEKPDYTSIPADAQELSEVQTNLKPNASYKITSEYNGTFDFLGNNGNDRTKLYVNSTWIVPNDFTFLNGIEIIVMDKGKIKTSKKLEFVHNSVLTIMDRGTAVIANITFTNGEPAGLRNWGTLSVTDMITLSSGAAFYNAGIIKSKNIKVSSNSQIVNDKKIEIEEYFKLPSDFTMENNGEIYGKGIIAESSSIINNNNIILFETISFTNPTINNTCSIEATTSFYANGCTINLNKGYLKSSNMEFVNGTVNLTNSSMIEATTKLNLSGTEFYGTSENTSMIKSSSIDGKNFKYSGHLVIESDNHVEKDQWWDNFKIENGAYLTKIGESKVTIDMCTGIKNEGNGGSEPTNPEFPIEVEDNKNYTYLFEDQWPLYGDYDMNDIVLSIQKRKISTNKENKVTKFELSIDLSAAGATKSIGAAIMLDNVPVNAIAQSVEFSNNTLTKNFNLNNNNIENGQDYAVIPLFDDAHKVLGRDRYEQINTVSNYAGNTKPKNISFSITFNNPTISADAFNVNKLNVFIIVDGNRNPRKEIHVAGYQPTKLANTDLFGGNNDNSHHGSKKYYISKENLAWGIMVPSNFKWPLEYVNIKTAYSQFSDWVTSGGTENEKWWNDFDVSKVFQTNKN